MERINLFFSIVNTIVLIVGGVLGYFLIEKEYLKESKSNIELATSKIVLNHTELGLLISEKVLNDIKTEFAPINEALEVAKNNGEIILNLSQTRLNETNSKLVQLEIDLINANAKIDALSKRANISINVSTLINDVQPILENVCKSSNHPVIRVECTYTNRGAHKVYIPKPTIEIYRTDSNTPVPNTQYKVRSLRDNVILPGISGSNTFFIDDYSGELVNDFEIKINFVASIHSTVKSAVSPILSELINKESLDALFKQGYTIRLGDYPLN